MLSPLSESAIFQPQVPTQRHLLRGAFTDPLSKAPPAHFLHRFSPPGIVLATPRTSPSITRVSSLLLGLWHAVGTQSVSRVKEQMSTRNRREGGWLGPWAPAPLCPAPQSGFQSLSPPHAPRGNPCLTRTMYARDIYFSYFSFFLRFYLLFFYRGEGERDRNIDVWLPLVRPLLGTWPATRACALTGNRTGSSMH